MGHSAYTFAIGALCAAFALGAALPAAAQSPPAGAAAAHAMVPDKSRRSHAQRKVDAQLLFDAARSFLARDVASDGGTFVVVRAEVSEDLLQALRDAGARDINAFERFDTVTAVVPVTALESLAGRDDVLSIRPRELFKTQRYFPTPEEEQAILATLPPRPKVGSVNWEGVTAHQADKAHATGFLGAGTKICVISDGVDSLSARIASGNLPASVSVLPGQAGSGDEGTAMLELIYDMAPGATLGFATADPSMAQFATNILNLRFVAGCDVIVDDIGYFLEGTFQDDAIAQAVNSVASSGALYFSAAGNSGSLSHGTSATYERDFVASASAPPAVIASAEGAPVTLHSFGAQPYTTLTRATSYITLHWGERLDGAASDYDLFVTDSTGSTILGTPGGNAQSGSQDAVEIAYCDSCSFPAGARIYVVKYSGQNRAIRLNAINGRLANATSGSTYGHPATSGAIAVGAVDVRAVSGAFTGGGANPTTFYSSDGPRKFFFTPGGGAVTAGNTAFATNGGVTLPKVDFAASDCGKTTTPGFTTAFCGTSAAAPTAAALAALVRSAAPFATPAQVKAALTGSALDIEGAGVDSNSGAGIPMAASAVRSLLANIMVAKDFTPAVILAGGGSLLRIQLNNPNAVAISGIAFTNTYPGTLRNVIDATTTMAGAGCTGTLTGVPGGNTLALANATIPANTVCSYTIMVTSATPAVFVDNSGAVTTPIGLNSPPFSARLDVGTLPDAPTGVTATAGVSSITVAYTPPAYTGGIPLVGFVVTCTPSAPAPAVVLATQSMTFVTMAPLVNGLSYACTVAASNAAGTGPAATAASPATPIKASQAISVLSTPPAQAYVGGPAHEMHAISNGGNPVFTVAAASISVCVVAPSSPPLNPTVGSWGMVTFLGAGTCVIEVTSPANDSFTAAPLVTQSIPVVLPTALVAATTPNTFNFGGQSMGTDSAPRPITIGNYTGAPVTVTGVTVSGPFRQSNDCAMLAPGATCTVTVTFTPPAAAGAINATIDLPGQLTVASNAPAPAMFTLAGTAEKSLVTHYYRAILNRAPDSAGKSFWQGEAARLAGLAVDVNETWYVMAGYFFNSAEYRAGNKSDAAFVTDLYRTFFNRDPDGTGLAYWSGQVQSGLPREVVLFSFMFSPEFATFTQGIFGNTAARPEVNLVMDFFRGILNRLPDTASLQYWVGRLKAAQCSGPGAVYTEVDAISSFFMFSPEYNQRGRNSTQLVTDMYYSFLRRGGDAGGVTFWINQLQTGTLSADAVRRNFIASPEFGARVNAVVAAGCQP